MASTTSSSLANLLRAGGRTPAQRKRILHPGSVAMLVAGLAVIVGSMMPWVLTPIASLSGLAGPGWLTMCGGFIAIAGALFPRRWAAIVHCLIAGGTVGLVAGWQLVRLAQISEANDSWGQAMPGIGLVLVSGGAVILLATAVRLIRTPAVVEG